MENTDTQHIEKLKAYWEAHQAFPSMAKLREVVGMASTASVFEMVGRLVEAGYLQRIEGRIAPASRFFDRPILPAGAFDEPKELPALNIASYLMPATKTFLIEVPDDQLANEHILQGDVLVVEQAHSAQAGDLVVRRHGVGWSLMRMPDAPTAQPSEELNLATWSKRPQGAVLGVAVSLIRRFDRRTKWPGAEVTMRADVEHALRERV